MEERTKLEEKLEQIIQEYGAESTLWALARTLSTDNLKNLIADTKWALGE